MRIETWDTMDGIRFYGKRLGEVKWKKTKPYSFIQTRTHILYKLQSRQYTKMSIVIYVYDIDIAYFVVWLDVYMSQT